MGSTVQTILNCIKYEICGQGERGKVVLPEVSARVLSELYRLSKAHDMAHLVGDALSKCGAFDNLPDTLEENERATIEKIKAKFDEQVFTAVYRYENINYELEQLKQALNKAQIMFLPLKGSVIREYYPEPWMRTSCDIDVLVHEEDCEKARTFLVDECGYSYQGKESHDVSLFTPSGIHVELHYDLIEEGIVNGASRVLKNVWDVSIVRDGYAFWREMPDEMFYFYHIAHMAKHFVGTGGCGIRPFLDIWILNHRISFDRERREALLSEGGLDVFAKQAELLSEIWFGNAEHTEITRQMEEYILRGGVYGTSENRIAVQQQKRGGKVKYALSKIFIPYDVIKFHYPVLQKHKWLTPVMEARRWGKLIFCGHLKRSVKELRYNNSISGNEAAQTQAFLKNVGL